MGAFGPPVVYGEAKKAQEINLENAKGPILECWDEFYKVFNHRYLPVETYRSEDADTILLVLGSASDTASLAIDKMCNEGKKVGLVSIRLWRPFPFEEIRQAVKDAKVMIVVDKAISFGGPGGVVCSEVRSALYNEEKRPKVVGFVGGLGGRDITPHTFEEVINQGMEISQKGSEREFELFGVRG
jgi:pyruvate ferredoxin oxidoreductase alpha subunit